MSRQSHKKGFPSLTSGNKQWQAHRAASVTEGWESILQTELRNIQAHQEAKETDLAELGHQQSCHPTITPHLKEGGMLPNICRKLKNIPKVTWGACGTAENWNQTSDLFSASTPQVTPCLLCKGSAGWTQDHSQALNRVQRMENNFQHWQYCPYLANKYWFLPQPLQCRWKQHRFGSFV